MKARLKYLANIAGNRIIACTQFVLAAALVIHVLLLLTARLKEGSSSPSSVHDMEELRSMMHGGSSSSISSRTSSVSRRNRTKAVGSNGTVPEVMVAVLNKHYWAEFFGYDWMEMHCKHKGLPLVCRMVHVHGNKDYEDPAAAYDLVSRADGLMYSLCPGPRHPAAHPDTPVILHSLESSHMYPCINDAARMRHVQIEMTYRTCSQVPVHYYGSFGEGQYPAYRGIQKESLPFEEKLDAIMAVISNCNVSSGRQEIMWGLQKAINETGSKLQIHQYGACARNMPKEQVEEFNNAGGLAKSIWGRKYKFCVTIEYDIETDFVSDKLYQALTAGCVPIHLGAPNIDYFVPNMSAIIWYPEFGTPRALLAELERLAYNKTAYMEKLAWKKLDEWELSPGFTRLFELSQHSPVCRLCMAVAEYREADPKPRKLLCTANSTWWAASQTATELQEKMLRDAALAENRTSALNGSALHNSSSASGLIWDPDHLDEDETEDGEAAGKPTAGVQAGTADTGDAVGKANAAGRAGADGKADAGTQEAGGKKKDARKTTDTTDAAVIDQTANKKLPVEIKGDAAKPSKTEEKAEGKNDAGKAGAKAGKGTDTEGAEGKTKNAAAKGNLDSKESAAEKMTDGKDSVAAKKKVRKRRKAGAKDKAGN